MFSDTPTKVAWQSPVDIIAVTGNGSTYFSNLGEQYRGSDGRILRNLVAANGKNLDDYGKVALAGFSAFHGLANLILDADSDLVDAMVSLDSCFSAIDHPAKRGYSKFAKKAARGSALLVFTWGPGGGPGSGATISSSTPDFSFAKDCVLASVAEAGSLRHVPVPDGLPPTDEGYALKNGGILILPYTRLRHDQHIHDLAVPLMQVTLAPYLAQTFSAFAVNLGVGAVSAVLGWLAYSHLLLAEEVVGHRDGAEHDVTFGVRLVDDAEGHVLLKQGGVRQIRRGETPGYAVLLEVQAVRFVLAHGAKEVVEPAVHDEVLHGRAYCWPGGA